MLPLAVAAALLAGCQAKPLLLRPTLEEEGAVYLYVRPFPPEAGRLSFSLEGVDALREDGSAVPLTLRMKDMAAAGLRRERLLAAGVLPPGRYEGFRVRAGKAALKGEAGQASLAISEGPARIDAPFAAKKGQVVVRSLALRYREAVGGGVVFTPAFSAEEPPRPAAGAIGAATSRAEGTVTVFDKVSGRVSGIVPAGREPSGMALSAERRRAYVAVTGEDRVDVLDLFENAVVDRLRLKTGDAPVEAVLTPDGRTLLTANSGSNTVSIVDPEALFELKRIPVGRRPASILVDPSGRRAFVFNEYSATISLVDIGSGTVAATIATEAAPVRGQFDREKTRLFVIHRNSPYLTVLDASTFALLRRIYVGTGAAALAVDVRTNRIYLARDGSPTIDAYDASMLLPIDSIPAGGDVAYMTVEREQNVLCIVQRETNGIRMVRLVGNRTAVEVDVGDDPVWVAFLGER